MNIVGLEVIVIRRVLFRIREAWCVVAPPVALNGRLDSATLKVYVGYFRSETTKQLVGNFWLPLSSYRLEIIQTAWMMPGM